MAFYFKENKTLAYNSRQHDLWPGDVRWKIEGTAGPDRIHISSVIFPSYTVYFRKAQPAKRSFYRIRVKGTKTFFLSLPHYHKCDSHQRVSNTGEKLSDKKSRRVGHGCKDDKHGRDRGDHEQEQAKTGTFPKTFRREWRMNDIECNCCGEWEDKRRLKEKGHNRVILCMHPCKGHYVIGCNNGGYPVKKKHCNKKDDSACNSRQNNLPDIHAWTPFTCFHLEPVCVNKCIIIRKSVGLNVSAMIIWGSFFMLDNGVPERKTDMHEMRSGYFFSPFGNISVTGRSPA